MELRHLRYFVAVAETESLTLAAKARLHTSQPSVTSRPLKGYTPTVELVLGYKKSNQSPVLKLLLSRLDELIARASQKEH